MGHYDTIPSKTDDDGLDVFVFGSEILDYDRTRSAVRKICRKYGVGYSLCRKDYGKFKYVFFIAVAIGENTAECGERKRLKDCIHEIDNRTCLYFPTAYSAPDDYAEPYVLTYDQLDRNMPFRIECAENCPLDDAHCYLVAECKYRKESRTGDSSLSDNKETVFRDLLGFVRLRDYDMEIRVARPVAGDLADVAELDGIVSACRIGIRFGSRPRCKDCSLYVVQMKDGKFRYAVVGNDGKAMCLESARYDKDNIMDLMRMHIRENKIRT